MKAAFIITLIAVINYARTVHTKDKTNNVEREQSNSSAGEGSQSLVISSRAKLTNENMSAAILPEPYEMDMLDGSELNEDESFVLVPLKKLVKNPRIPRDISSGDGKDPLYVMIPYKELSRKSKDFGEPVNIIATHDRIAVKRSTPLGPSNQSNVDDPGQKREERSIVQARSLFKTKITAKRNFKYPTIKNHERDTNFAKLGGNEALWEMPLAKYLSNSANSFSLVQTPKATYKTKKSLGNDLKNQFPQELLFPPIPQKPKVLTEFKDLNPKSKEIKSIISKQTKGSNGAVNITMYITNLIPPCEVENTRITNSGKLFKNGCLKFSIQLEKPCPEECCEGGGNGGCNNCVGNKLAGTTIEPHNKGCGHILELDKIGGNTNAGSSGNPTTGCSPGSLDLECLRYPNNLENAHSGAVPVSKLVSAGHAARATTDAPSKIDSNAAANRDVTSLLMKLMGLEKKPMRKPVQANPTQAVLVDNDIMKELQRLLTSNQGATIAAPEKHVPTPQAAPSPLKQHNQKAKAIADALNLFSKFSSVRQPSMQNR